MITLYSYPELFGVADNNPYGLKTFAFLKLCNMAFRHEHVFDAKAAPRGQLPYIDDDGEHVGDSDTIVSHLISKYRLTIDDALTGPQRMTDHLIRRMLDEGLIAELSERQRPDEDDERRRYYRITTFGRAVAQAEAARLATLLRQAKAVGLAPGRA